MKSQLLPVCVLLFLCIASGEYVQKCQCRYGCSPKTSLVPHCPEYDENCHWGRCGINEQTVCIGSKGSWCCPNNGRVCGFKCFVKALTLRPALPACPPTTSGRCEWRKYQCKSNQELICIGSRAEFAWCCDACWP